MAEYGLPEQRLIPSFGTEGTNQSGRAVVDKNIGDYCLISFLNMTPDMIDQLPLRIRSLVTDYQPVFNIIVNDYDVIVEVDELISRGWTIKQTPLSEIAVVD